MFVAESNAIEVYKLIKDMDMLFFEFKEVSAKCRCGMLYEALHNT